MYDGPSVSCDNLFLEFVKIEMPNFGLVFENISELLN